MSEGCGRDICRRRRKLPPASSSVTPVSVSWVSFELCDLSGLGLMVTDPRRGGQVHHSRPKRPRWGKGPISFC